MNAIEIEEAVTKLASEPFNGDEFPYDFLRAFGNKDTTIKKLRSGASNKSDVGGVLQTNNIHIKVASIGQVNSCLNQLKQSPATTKAKARFIVATDGVDFEAEDPDMPPVGPGQHRSGCVLSDCAYQSLTFKNRWVGNSDQP